MWIKPYHDEKRPGEISTRLSELYHRRWYRQAISTGKEPELIRNEPYQDGKWPGVISTSLIELDHLWWQRQAFSNRIEAGNDVEQAILRWKLAGSDKYKNFRTGPPEMISTSLINRKGARVDKEQALSRRKVVRSDKYVPYRTGPPEMIRTSLSK